MFTRLDLNRVHQQFLDAITDSADLGLTTGAERMLARVNETRAERGDEPARLSQVVALHELAAGGPEPGRAYALHCALLALDPAYAHATV